MKDAEDQNGHDTLRDPAGAYELARVILEKHLDAFVMQAEKQEYHPGVAMTGLAAFAGAYCGTMAKAMATEGNLERVNRFLAAAFRSGVALCAEDGKEAALAIMQEVMEANA